MWCLRVVVAGFAIWAAVRGFGLDGATPVVQLISFTPYVAAASVLPLLAALATRRWREAAVALLVVVAFGVFVLPRAVAGSGAAGRAGAPLTVLTVNVLHGDADTGRILALIRRERPDVVSVQELTDEAVARLDAAGIARELPHRALRPRPGVSGTGLYARYPLSGGAGLDSRSTFDMTRAVLALPRRDVEVIAVHTSPPLPGGAVQRWERDFGLLPRAQNGGLLRVLAGDFNATLDHSALRRLLGSGYRDSASAAGAGLVPSWPHGSGLPPVTIDHVLVDERAGARSVEVFDIRGSDHRAVVARLALPR